jgi:hypothetical protein
MELTRLTKAPYTAKAKLKDPDGQEEEIRVIYNPMTAATLREIEAIRTDDERTIVDQALLLVRELPDITNEGQPVKIDRALFEEMDVRHVGEIVQAVTTNFFAIEPTDEVPTLEAIERAERHLEDLNRERAERDAATAAQAG